MNCDTGEWSNVGGCKDMQCYSCRGASFECKLPSEEGS